MRRREWMALGASLAAAAAGCGYPQFSFTGAGGGAASSTSGGAGAACSVLDDTSCGASSKCSVEDPGTGAVGCVAVDVKPVAAFDLCFDDAACPAGTWCNLLTSVCSPFCRSGASPGDCKAGTCIPATDGNGTNIPGIEVCTAHCDPVTASPCGAGASCDYDPVDGFDCAAAGLSAEYGACVQSTDCGQDLVCVTDGSIGGTCMYWCAIGDTSPGACSKTNCMPLVDPNMNPITYDGATCGYCQ